MTEFAGRTAVITGGGSGMGRELVRLLVAEACNVAMCDVSPTGLAETQRLCEAAGLPTLTADQAASAVQADRGTEPSTLMGSGNTKSPRSAAGGIERNRKFVDSLLEGDGFEPSVPRAIQARLEAKITGF